MFIIQCGGNEMSATFETDCRIFGIAGCTEKLVNFTKPVALVALCLLFSGGAAKSQILGSAEDFAVLAGSTVTNTGPTVINGGSVGVWPSLAIVGFPPGLVTPPGTFHAGDGVAELAQTDLTTAYDFVAGLPSDFDLSGQDLGGLTLSPAVYSFTSSAQLTGVLTLDGQGDPDAEFFFQIGSTLTTASDSAVLLINGANGNNVYWQVGSSATLGTNTVFAGNILANESITLNTGAVITCGRALARTGAVTLDNNVITICATGLGAGNGNGNDIPIDVLGGEGVTGTEPTAFDASSLFGSVLLGQGTFWRDGTGPGVNGMTPESIARDRARQDGPGRSLKDGADYSYKDESALSIYYPRTWRLWATGFGGYNSLDGNSATASPGVDSRTLGFAAGFDYQIDPTALVGIAAGYTRSTFSVDDRATSGTLDGVHFGVYGVKNFGQVYLAGTAVYASFENDTDRLVDWIFDERAKGDFSSELYRARIEAGWRQQYYGTNVTPFAALDVAHLSSDSYVESSERPNGDPGILGLTFESRSASSVRSSLGVQLDTTMVLENGETFTPFARIAWVHEFNTGRGVDSFLTASPGASFSFDGAEPPSDVLQVNAGLKLDIDSGVALFAAFDGEFSGESQKYAGAGGLKITW
jgi:outer membrane autotransporter protein